MKNIVILLAVLLAAEIAWAREPKTINISDKFDSGVAYTLIIIEKPFIKDSGYKEDDGGIWGIDGGFPKTIIDTIRIEIDGQDIFIPWKYYFDITNINSAEIFQVKDYFELIVKGGDAAGSYVAKFKIKKNRLIERIVRMGEFPDDVWEKSTLHNNLWDNGDM